MSSLSCSFRLVLLKKTNILAVEMKDVPVIGTSNQAIYL